eukprot:TRINITY_DN1924_c1_g1_i1.p1 TRINITY_DN1924_c1_g1~~TRINITY_DN1924_c1_g1_i1.p1  ORF type:complete len:161 (+),score=16.31 TRINITY_DN1924_c1_g1_i1:44-526(+)
MRACVCVRWTGIYITIAIKKNHTTHTHNTHNTHTTHTSAFGETRLVNVQVAYAPVLVAAIRQVASYDDWDFAFPQFFHGYLQRVRFSVQFHHDRRIHTDLQSACTKDSCTFVLGHVFGGLSSFTLFPFRYVVVGRVNHFRSRSTTRTALFFLLVELCIII